MIFTDGQQVIESTKDMTDDQLVHVALEIISVFIADRGYDNLDENIAVYGHTAPVVRVFESLYSNYVVWSVDFLNAPQKYLIERGYIWGARG